jgi:uncharacterized protein YciI
MRAIGLSMSYFVVIRETGPAWDTARGLREQNAWEAHADFINAASADGLVLLGGKLGAGGSFLLMLNAESEAEIRRRLEDDPWTKMGLLQIASIEPWEQLTGTDLIEAAASSLT